MGLGGGGVIKEGLILVISIVTLQNCFGDLDEVCGKYPVWVKVPGPLIFATFSPSSVFYLRILIYMGFWGPVIKRGSNFSYLDCYIPKLFWRPR